MTSLRWGLALLGGLVLLAMLGRYLWLTRRQRPMPAPDVAVGEREPALQEPTLDDLLDTPDTPKFVLPTPDRKPLLDTLIDTIVPIALDASISAELLMAALPPTRRVGSKLFAVEGLCTATQTWELPRSGQSYSAVQAGLQLANRSGALNEIEFSDFVIQTQRLCDAIGGTPDFPDMRMEVARARELDQFASAHDAQICFVLRAQRATWSPHYVQQMAVRQGFVMGAMTGRMVLPAQSAGAQGVLTLICDGVSDDVSQPGLREVHLTLDVPHVPEQEAAFSRMCAVAQALAQEMDGVVTDDNGVTLPAAAMSVIDAELDQLYAVLAQHEFAAGSALARRLFS